jgi:uncharacterized membrane protein
MIGPGVASPGGDEDSPVERSGAVVRRRPGRVIIAVLAVVTALTAVLLVWLWPTGPRAAGDQTKAAPQVTGKVVGIDPGPCPATPDTPNGFGPATVCGTATVTLTGGPDAGKQITSEIPSGAGTPKISAGDSVVLMYLADAPTDRRYQIIDRRRDQQLWILAAAFALSVIAFGRLRGLTALAGLAVTFAILLMFIVPAILAGKPPLLVAIAGSAAIVVIVLYLTLGINLTTSVAVLGTLASLALTGLLAVAATEALALTGVADEDANYLTLVQTNVDMRGLLLAGVLIGAIGVLDDVTVTQATAVEELAKANPRLGFRDLYRSGARVGRAHIASVINTIVLAYAGASMPVLLLISVSNLPLNQILTNQFITQEILRSAVGIMGLVAAVPVTTALAALIMRDKRQEPAATPAPSRPRRPKRPVRRSPAPAPTATIWQDDDPDTTPALEALTRRLGNPTSRP